MKNKFIYTIAIIIFLTGIFTVFVTMANAAGSNLLCSNNPKMIVTLKNEAKINNAKNKISEISGIKIIKIQDRDKEWSKMVNKMDLPKMENPFKNEFTLKIKKKADINEISDKIKEMDFVESVKFTDDKSCKEE